MPVHLLKFATRSVSQNRLWMSDLRRFDGRNNGNKRGAETVLVIIVDGNAVEQIRSIYYHRYDGPGFALWEDTITVKVNASDQITWIVTLS